MASKIGNVYAELSVRDQMSAGLQKASRSLTTFGSKFGPVTAVAGALAATLGYVAKSAVDAASDMEESVSKSNVVFGYNAKAMERWADTAAKAFGQSKQQAIAAASSFGNMFMTLGVGSDEAANMSKSMVELAADLASFNNTDTEDAIHAIGAALRGESEPIRRYDVLLNDATLKAKALEMGLYSGKGALDMSAKALAAYQVILEQTKTAQGDYKRTSDGLANSQKSLGAMWQDAKATLGEALLPATKSLVNMLAELDIKGLAHDLGLIVGVLGDIAIAAGKAGRALVKAFDFRDHQKGARAMAKQLETRLAGAAAAYGPDGYQRPATLAADTKLDPATLKQMNEELEARKKAAAEVAKKRLDEARKASIAEHNQQIELDADRFNRQREQNQAIVDQLDAQELDRKLKMHGLDGGLDGVAANVNSMQARGLAMGAMDAPQIAKDSRDYLKEIRDVLRESLNREAVAVF